jgi:hypothetical protein
MPSNRMNHVIAGYHILMILSAVDNKFNPEEDKIIQTYLIQQFPFTVSLDKEIETISSLLPIEWESHFLKCMDDFMDDSTIEERNNLLKFAIHLIKADLEIGTEENRYIKLLYDGWDDAHE